MDSGTRAGRLVRWGAVAVGGLALYAACAVMEAGGDRAVIEQADLVGDWGNRDGTRLHIAGEHSVSISGLDQAVPDNGCPMTVSVGTWSFLEPKGSRRTSPPPEPLTGSDAVDLELKPDVGYPRACSVFVKVQRDDDGYDLCLVMDPDQTCMDDELLRKRGPRSG
ncbi:hypothetical protein [Streptomyces rubellomurinus]|uniref:hypothetical protein n=1 Tax=Streptomyces rubellomurinus (strain ATCC 31215) TaxID=359131 RepID=UPI000B2EC440|nr:hypothetical protein [Streptomyces rubellomurinus]